MMDISDERLGDLWRMPDHYMRPISFGRAVALAARVQALEEAAKVCEPSNMDTPSDWTVLAKVRAECATKIRRLLGEDAGRGG